MGLHPRQRRPSSPILFRTDDEPPTYLLLLIHFRAIPQGDLHEASPLATHPWVPEDASIGFVALQSLDLSVFMVSGAQTASGSSKMAKIGVFSSQKPIFSVFRAVSSP